MKKSINSFLCLAIVFSLTLNLSAQSTKEELDQLELMKQFIGTWELPIAEDSVVVVTITAFGDGIVTKQENKANGKAYSSFIGVWGVSSDKKAIEQVGIGDDEPFISYEYGRFVSPKKFMSELYYKNSNHAIRLSEIEFLTPETINYRIKYRGEKISWDAEWSPMMTIKKVE